MPKGCFCLAPPTSVILAREVITGRKNDECVARKPKEKWEACNKHVGSVVRILTRKLAESHPKKRFIIQVQWTGDGE